MRILIVEDEPELAEVLVAALESERYAVDLAASAGAADEMMAVNEYDAAILDWNLPDASGVELLSGWRRDQVQTPVLMLTARGSERDKVNGLDTGADDYLTKPFSLAELLARLRSLLRRRQKLLQVLQAGDLELDRTTRRVTVAGVEVALQAKEFGVLEYLLSRLDEPVSRTELTEHVWDESFDAMSNVVDTVIYRLRKKIDGGRRGRLLHTVRGVGYVLKSERC